MNSRFSPAAVALFELFFRPWMRRRVGAIHSAGLPVQVDPDRPLLLVANHVSWWDAFVIREIQRTLRPRAPLYTLMSAAELERFPYFRWMGVVGVDGISPARTARVVRGLGRKLRERPDSVILIFPQGGIWPSHRRPLGFQRGVELFARRLDAEVVPVGIHAEPLASVSPSFFVSMGIPCGEDPTAGSLEWCVESHLDAILGFLALHGERSALAWPASHYALEPSVGAGRPWQ